ncbi:hypothetical protein BGX26_002286 [Mortierella sp. AD094]|nr:hypothetical protein BGX26_002286 [Mortierella sp. AD094]
MMSRVLPINSGPVSIPAGSLIPGDDGGLGIMQSSATRNLRPVFASSTRLPDDQTPSLVSNIATSSSTLTATPPGVSEATNPTSLQLPELQQDPNLHIPPVFAQSQSVTLDQTPSELSTPSSDVYHEFVDATHRARAAMRAVDLAMDEIQSMRRRTLNVVGRFVSILDDTEQTGDASLTTGLQGPPAPTVAQPLMAVANEAGDMIPSTLQSDSQSISGHSAGSELNPHTTMDPNNSDTLTQHAVASTSESAFVGSSHSSSSLPTGQSQ